MHALRVLEFEAIRQRLADLCETPLAREHALALLPSFEAGEAERLLTLTSEAYDALSSQSPPTLYSVKNFNDSLKRASKGGILPGEELYRIGSSLQAMRALREFIYGRRAASPQLWGYAENLPELKRLDEKLLFSLESNGDVKDEASISLGGLRQRKKAAVARIIERVQSYTTGPTRELLSDPIYTVRDGRYVVPLKAENRGKIRGIVHDTSGSGQTIYVEPEPVLQLGNALREIESQERDEILKVLKSLSEAVGAEARQIEIGLDVTCQIDLVFAKARLAFDLKATAPQLLAQAEPFIEIQSGRHPLLDPAKVIPLDLKLSARQNVLITGPNTGGKTVAIKTVGLFVFMAQSGLFVSATHVKMAPFTQIWADIGDEQSLEQSLSTFSGHIKNISEALKKLKKGALVLLDEIGAGTDPAEGASLAISILRAFRQKGACVLASTHYGELKAFAYTDEEFVNAAMEFDPKSLQPTYRLLMGAPGASQALRIAERYGLSKEIIEEAKTELSEGHKNVAEMLRNLENAQRLARQAQSEADRRAAELSKLEAKANEKLARAEEIRLKASTRANEAIEIALREIRLDAARLFEELRRAPEAQASVRQGLRDLQAVGQELATEFAPLPKASAKHTGELKKGQSVRIEGYTQVALLLEDPKNGQVLVLVGVMKMTVPVSKLSPAQPERAPIQKSKKNLGLEKAQTSYRELHLRQFRAEEAEEELMRFIDEAILAGHPSIRIVHGKGEGILRLVTQKCLSRHPHIESFRDGEPPEGGHGVTIATLK